MSQKKDKINKLKSLLKSVETKASPPRKRPGGMKDSFHHDEGPFEQFPDTLHDEGEREFDLHEDAGSFSEDAVPPRTLYELIHGEDLETDDGKIFLSQESYPLFMHHGTFPLNKALDISPEVLKIVSGDDSLADFDVKNALFLDTETTGLSQSAGSYAFLIGLGFFRDEEFVIQQVFMHHPEDEPALISWLEAFLKRFTALVTFNGKQYDIPLIKTRFLMNGLSFPINQVKHVDLLHIARRLWRLRLRWCNLINLEHRLLEFNRVDDIPGADIPQVYTEYRETANANILAMVFHHNRLDILTMVSLFSLINEYFKENRDESTLPQADLYSMAKVYRDRHLSNDAISLFQRVIDEQSEPQFRYSAMKDLSLLLKRQGKQNDAVECWKTMTREQSEFDVLPFIELAKYYEHQQKDFSAAIKVCKKCLNQLDNSSKYMNYGQRIQIEEEINHRLKRLNKKNNRESPSG